MHWQLKAAKLCDAEERCDECAMGPSAVWFMAAIGEEKREFQGKMIKHILFILSHTFMGKTLIIQLSRR